jgi:hypothetical protein
MWEGAALCTSRGVGRCRPYAQGVPALLYRDTGTGNYEHVTPEPQTYLRLPFHTMLRLSFYYMYAHPVSLSSLILV